MKKIIPLLLCISIVLSGCYGIDIDEQSFVIAVGIDKGKSYRVRTTFVFSNPIESGGEEKTSTAAKSTDIVTIEAPSVFSAVRKLNYIKSKKINLTHTKLIVFSRELAEDGIGEFVDGFVSSHDFRPNTYVCISTNSADKFLRSAKPVQESFLEKYYDHIIKKAASDKVNESYLYYLHFNFSEKSSGSLVPLVGTNKNELPKETDLKTIESDDFALNEKAGKILRKAENEAEFSGTAIFKDDKMVASLGSFYTDIARFIGNEFYPASYTFRIPSTGDFVTVKINQHSPPDISAKLKNNNAHIKIKIPIELEYVDPLVVDTPKKSKEFTDYITSVLNKKAKYLIKKTQEDYQSDIFSLGDYLKRYFIDYKKWEKFNWKEKYKTAKIDVSFKIKYADYEEVNH